MIIPNHIAIILDGNGRWAKNKLLPRNMGHYNGGKNLFKIASDANELGVKELTVFAFSTENWKRPKEEVEYLMQTPIIEYEKYKDRIGELKYRVEFAGRKDRLKKDLLNIMDDIVLKTKDNEGMTLTICVDYGSKDELITAINKANKPITFDEINRNLMVKNDVDLLIRTSGEMRISNFLLWQSAYAELFFCKKYWPDFSKKDLVKAIKEYNKRQRRFGGLK